MIRDGMPWASFADLRFDGDDAMRDIAALIRSGCDDPLFLKLLADHIDPDTKTPFGTKFTLRHRKGGRPKARPNLDLESFMWRHADMFGEKQEAVIAAAKAKFGVGKTACTSALASAREGFRSDPELERIFRESELDLRERGDPDAQPLFPKNP